MPAGLSPSQLYRLFWAGIYALYQSRLAALELFESRDITAELDLSDGLTFTYRNKADIFDPLDNPPTNPGGLHGGVTYGFEFAASYNAFKNNPQSNEGNLRRAFVTSLGGSGYQKAAFDNGIITIQSETSVGRVSYYSVSELGKIGCFWNKAKHVVVYERTVSRSLQFAGNPNAVPPVGPDQEKLTGQFVVRKVLEYIEILEPIRTYPDLSNQNATQQCGFLEACEFKTRVIRVNSTWGSDIKNNDPNNTAIGFQIPLWRNLYPVVYPRPVVVVQLTTQEANPPNSTPAPQAAPAATAPANGVPPPAVPVAVAAPLNQASLEAVLDGRSGSTFAELDEPENLVFYSLPNLPPEWKVTTPSDTDTWPAIAGIDASLFDAPDPPDGDYAKGHLDDTLADEESVQPGFYKQTFALKPSSENINLVSRRSLAERCGPHCKTSRCRGPLGLILTGKLLLVCRRLSRLNSKAF